MVMDNTWGAHDINSSGKLLPFITSCSPTPLGAEKNNVKCGLQVTLCIQLEEFTLETSAELVPAARRDPNLSSLAEPHYTRHRKHCEMQYGSAALFPSSGVCCFGYTRLLIRSLHLCTSLLTATTILHTSSLSFIIIFHQQPLDASSKPRIFAPFITLNNRESASTKYASSMLLLR